MSPETNDTPETLPILYRDDALVVVHKPSGLLVHKSLIDKHETRYAMRIIRDQIGQYVYPVHRLDKPTSGILVFALSSDIARIVSQQIENKQWHKEYHAWVRGWLKDQHIDYALKEKLDKIADKMADQNKDAQAAQTDVQCLQRFEIPKPTGRYTSTRCSFVKLIPHTGRKHQLRRHLAHVNHPILGDTTHGDGKHNQFYRDECNLHRLGLAHTRLTMTHPLTNKPLVIECPLSEELKGFSSHLEAFAFLEE